MKVDSLPLSKIQALAARRLNEQQIADVIDIEMSDIITDRIKMTAFREAIRKGRAKGEAELRGSLYKKANSGDIQAYVELMRLEKIQDAD